MNHKSRYIWTKFRIGLHSKSKSDIILKLWHLRLCNFSGKSGENVTQLEITETVLVFCDIFTDQYQHV